MGNVLRQEPARIVGQVKCILFFATAMGFQIDGNLQASLIAGVAAFASLIAGEIVRAHVTPTDNAKTVVRKVEDDVKAEATKTETNPVAVIVDASKVVEQTSKVYHDTLAHEKDNAAAPEPAPAAQDSGLHPMTNDPESPYATAPVDMSTTQHADDTAATASQPEPSPGDLPAATGATLAGGETK